MNFRELQPRLLKEFKLDKVLGSGAYGVVLQALNYDDNQTYAVKVVAGNIEVARREVDNLLKIPSHPNVVHYYTCWEDELTVATLEEIKKKLKISTNDDTFRVPIGAKQLKILCIQMELCGEDLRSWIGNQKYVDEARVTKMFIQIAKGLEHIHQQKIIHRDLKPDNIFLGKEDPAIVKIGDLGIATEHLATKSAAHTRRMGTPLYLAPEQGSSRYGRPADLYALGLILFEMFNPRLQPTANGGSYETLFKGFIDLKYKNVIPSSIKTRWPKISELILKMIKVSPEERPSFPEIYKTFRFTDTNNDNPNIAAPPIRKIDGKTEANPEVIPGPKKDFVPKGPILPIQEVCAGCYKPIIEGAKIKMAMEKKWHPEHFKCNRCFKVLDEFIDKEGKAYCQKDFHELFSPKCAHCNEAILGTVTKVLGKTWHPEHVPKGVNTCPTNTKDIVSVPKGSIQEVCAGCYKPLKGGKITTAMGKKWHPEHFQCSRCFKVLDGYFDKDEKAYCEKDFHELFSPKCAYCNEAIRGTVTKARGKTWHPEHIPKDLNPGPAKDIEFVPKGSIRELCAGCYKPIEGGKITTAMGKKWHSEHFKCSRCFKVLDTFFDQDGKAYCEMDFHELFSPKCGHCHKAIHETVTKAMGKTWHPEHFFCAKCLKPLDGPSYLTKDDKPYCQTDYFDLFAPRCFGCKKAIIDAQYTSTENPVANWHPQCFVCSECNEPLTKYFTRGDHFYCTKHR